MFTLKKRRLQHKHLKNDEEQSLLRKLLLNISNSNTWLTQAEIKCASDADVSPGECAGIHQKGSSGFNIEHKVSK